VKVALTPLPPIEEALVNCDQGFFFSFDWVRPYACGVTLAGEVVERY
jgi:hypothetical protein